MVDSLKVVATGAAGATGIEVIPQIVEAVGTSSPIISTLLQIAVGIVTLFKLLKQKRK